MRGSICPVTRLQLVGVISLHAGQKIEVIALTTFTHKRTFAFLINFPSTAETKYVRDEQTWSAMGFPHSHPLFLPFDSLF